MNAPVSGAAPASMPTPTPTPSSFFAPGAGIAGPNILSVNSASLIPLYSTMEKSETYRRHIRTPGYELFFKPPSTAAHRERKRAWGALFTVKGYILRLLSSIVFGRWNANHRSFFFVLILGIFWWE